MSDDIRLSATTVNAPDALALATFYAELTGGDALGSEHWATADTDGVTAEAHARSKGYADLAAILATR